MGLEMLAMQNRVLDKIHTSQIQMEETNMRLGVGFLAMFAYMFIGAVVFCRIEAPLEEIEHETYSEFRNHWTKLLTSKGISGGVLWSLFLGLKFEKKVILYKRSL